MSDLNELAKFEAELKKLIETRETFKPYYAEPKCDDMLTLMHVSEHGQPYKTSVWQMHTRMSIPEHGQPYKTPVGRTKMVILEHGQPYKNQTQNNCSITYMNVIEHGQPYKQNNKEDFIGK